MQQQSTRAFRLRPKRDNRHPIGKAGKRRWRLRLWPWLLLVSVQAVPWARAQYDLEQGPFQYSVSAHRDPVALLQQKLDAGQVKLEYEARRAYLPALLRELNISERTQVLVFSKTSFQRTRISTKKPRALYFNDDTYLGWVQHGEVLEISSVDPRLGTIFYSLSQDATLKPRIVRQTDECLQCHASAMTLGIPGQVVRSVYPNSQGTPILSAGSFRTTYQSPLRERWGGWYVTGTHGSERHMGNSVMRNSEQAEAFDREPGANVTDLRPLLPVDAYLTPHSDIVALMVLEHQGPTHNQFALASYQAQLARRDQELLNQMAGKPASEPLESIERRYQTAADKLVECLLFCGEAKLGAPVRGTSGFTEYFTALGPRDRRGRSLREFDLQRRLFKYPCSYLIYTTAFRELPQTVKSRTYRRLWEVLTAQHESPEFSHLTRDDRRAVYEILSDTATADLPDFWRSRTP